MKAALCWFFFFYCWAALNVITTRSFHVIISSLSKLYWHFDVSFNLLLKKREKKKISNQCSFSKLKINWILAVVVWWDYLVKEKEKKREWDGYGLIRLNRLILLSKKKNERYFFNSRFFFSLLCVWLCLFLYFLLTLIIKIMSSDGIVPNKWLWVMACDFFTLENLICCWCGEWKSCLKELMDLMLLDVNN